MAGCTQEAGTAPARIRTRTRRSAPARGRCPFLARHGEELLGRLVERHARIDALVDVVVRTYTPLPGASLLSFVREMRFAVPQWRGELKSALQRARAFADAFRSGGAGPHTFRVVVGMGVPLRGLHIGA